MPMSNTALCRILVAALIILHGPPALAAHPLDALSGKEIAAAVAVLRASGEIDAETRFALIDLDEPPKADVLAWKPGQSFVRKAFIVARRDRTVYEAVIDLGARRLERWEAVPNVQSAILAEEWKDAQQITRADPGWQAAMRKRGYTGFEYFFCAPLPAGYFADPAEEGHRLLKITCFDTAGSRTNLWGRPIEGLYAVVDLDEKRVVRLVDTGPVPVSRDSHEFAQTVPPESAAKAAVKRNFTLDGNQVRWRQWSFHFRMDRRVGLILSLLRFADQGRQRMVMYRGSLAEMFVPYMDPGRGWSFRTYMDVGEYGFGLLSSPLIRGIDCPAGAVFIDATLPNDRGEPVLGRSRICLFERSADAPLWRHAETVNGAYAGRPATELVVRMIPSVGNYDYIIDWVLTEAGALRIDVGATGIDEVKGVAARTMADPSATRDTTYGTLVAPNLAAVNHDHFLSFRLDVDIDGPQNTLVRQNLVQQRLDDSAGRRSLWRLAEENVAEEGPLDTGPHGGDQIWRIVNPNRTNRLGQHPEYELRPKHSATSQLVADDFPQRRAEFSAAPLWITAYDPNELYAAGPYPNQSKGGDGLPAYASRHRPVGNADIVLWYTMGFHHLPRPEDWPVLPTLWHSVSLVPYAFFDRNPALGVRRQAAPSGPLK
jgi:primary-amine oxidase